MKLYLLCSNGTENVCSISSNKLTEKKISFHKMNIKTISLDLFAGRRKEKKINLYKFPVQLLSDKRQGGNLSGIRDDDDDDDK